MIASRRTNLKLTLVLCFAILAAIVLWLAILLLSQLALMEPVTAPAVQSLADNGDALVFVAAGDAHGPEANYASARLWVWFCIGTNGMGAVLIGLWLRAAMLAPAVPVRAPVQTIPAAPAAQQGTLIERAMQCRSQAGAGTMQRQLAAPEAGSRLALANGSLPATAPPSMPAPTAPGSGDMALRLARVARIIDNLAFQTTLLAVNAAVEAERGSRQPPRA